MSLQPNCFPHIWKFFLLYKLNLSFFLNHSSIFWADLLFPMIAVIPENELPFQGMKIFLPCICFALGETDVTNATDAVSSSLSTKSSLYTWACVSHPLPLHTKNPLLCLDLLQIHVSRCPFTVCYFTILLFWTLPKSFYNCNAPNHMLLQQWRVK